MCWVGEGQEGRKSAARRGKSFQREVVNISWDLPAPRDSSDPVTFQNPGMESSLHLMAEAWKRPLKGSELRLGPLQANVASEGSNGPFANSLAN